MNDILNEVRKERILQNEKWGEQNHLPIEWIAILTEEVGEAAKEALDHHFINPIKIEGQIFTPAAIDQRNRLDAYREELIQVAAVAVQMIEC